MLKSLIQRVRTEKKNHEKHCNLKDLMHLCIIETGLAPFWTVLTGILVLFAIKSRETKMLFRTTEEYIGCGLTHL